MFYRWYWPWIYVDPNRTEQQSRGDGHRQDRLMWTGYQFVLWWGARKTNAHSIQYNGYLNAGHTASLMMNQNRTQTTCFFQQIQNQTDSLVMKGQMSSYWFYFSKMTAITCSWREKRPSQIHLVAEQWVTHPPMYVCVCVPQRVGSASPRWVCFSPASAGSVWPAAHTPAGRCSDSDGPTAAACNTHTQTILTETVLEEHTLLADIKPNVVNIERTRSSKRF